MQQEAEITVNGTRLTNNEARMVRLALASFADIMANQLGFKDAPTGARLPARQDPDHTRGGRPGGI